ncbi:VOC family protein [Thermobifida halotolerans]|uniref:VOC family protein n=1 Tax=Thermobifida halotolerans TaxID=483545 RepID=A0A399FXL3_9ACTN|nr:VOC family protein [Thermobifida halotolerans]UOE21270.1 VOC family protein [Thermobifida halotolerans]
MENLDRAFPVVFSEAVPATAGFYERLGFTRAVEHPPGDAPTYVGLRRGSAELAVVDAAQARDRYGRGPEDGVRFEMFVFVAEVDAVVERLREEGVPVLRGPADMPWGERVAYVADPDGNPVGIASHRSASP